MRKVGIDYSLSCPAICIRDDGKFALHYLIDKKKWLGKFPTGDERFTIEGHAQKYYVNSEDRFDNISNWVMSLLKPTDEINIEGYAFAAAGLVFQIAENCGMLKHKLFKNGNTYHITPPSAAKKAATGKGNANKDLMCAAFVEQTGFDIFAAMNTVRNNSPINDMVDAYFLANLI